MISGKINTASSAPASDPPGMLQIANDLSAGIVAQTVAYAELSRVLNNFSVNMSDYAKKEDVQGQKMSGVATGLTIAQAILTAVAIVTPFAAVGLAAGAEAFSSGGAAIASRVVSATSQGFQGLASIGQGALQFYQSDLESGVKQLSTGVQTFDKITEKDTAAIQDLCKGAGTTGGQINRMVNNESAVLDQRFA